MWEVGEGGVNPAAVVHGEGGAAAAHLAGVAEGLYEYGSIASRDVRIRIDGDTAVMDGVVDMSVAAAGAPKEMTHLLFALVWVREGGKWRLYFRQATRIHG